MNDELLKILGNLIPKEVGGPETKATLALIIFLLAKFISLVITFIFGIICIKLVNKYLAKLKNDYGYNLSELEPFFDALIKIFFLIAIGSTALSAIGIDLVKYLDILSKFGIGLGFAVQASISNLISGLLIRNFGDFKVGDIIMLPDVIGCEVRGKITEIKLTETVLTTIEGKIIIIPNARLANNIVTKLDTGEEKEEIITEEGV